MGPTKKYTNEQEIELKAISKRHKDLWVSGIKSFCQTYPDRKYASVWQKVYALSGGTPPSKKSAKKKKGLPKKKEKKVKKKAERRSYNRKSHKSPLDSNYMTVSPNEVRFPIKSIRIEAGELIVTFK